MFTFFVFIFLVNLVSLWFWIKNDHIFIACGVAFVLGMLFLLILKLILQMGVL